MEGVGRFPISYTSYYLFFNGELHVAINHLLAYSVTIYVFYMIIYDYLVHMPLGGVGGGG